MKKKKTKLKSYYTSVEGRVRNSSIKTKEKKRKEAKVIWCQIRKDYSTHAT